MTSEIDKAKLAEIERNQGWKAIMGTPAARRVMWEVFGMLGIYQVTPSLDPQALAFNEGKRSVALRMMNEMLQRCPELHDRMVAEGRRRELESQIEENQE